MTDDTRKQIPIAVIGVAALMPGSPDAEGFWRHILAGTDLITDVPRSHWLIEDYYDPDPSAPDKTYCRRGGFLPVVDFDPMEFGIPPNNLSATDTAQLMSLMVAKKLLDDVTQGRAAIDGARASVILGVTASLELTTPLTSRLQRPIWARAMRSSGLPESQIDAICDRIANSFVPWQEASFPGLLGNVIAGRIANRFDLHGTNMTTDAACASSLSALAAGLDELSLRRADLVITGGVDADNDIFAYMCFSKTPALSPTGDCRPFSDNADGTLVGEGIAMFALKRLTDAERDGDRIYAVIRGVGSSSDGRSKSIYAPRPEGQALAVGRAYEAAGYDPRSVELVEAHGTGTKAGDIAEIEGLKAVFGGADARPRCAIGSVKSQIGHTKGAAGAAGLFKIVMALHHKVLPPTIKVERPNPALGLEQSPFYVNAAARPWIRDASHPRRAAVSSFGFGGTNYHVTAEEYVPAGAARRARSYRSNPNELVVLSASTPADLIARLAGLREKPPSLVQLAQDSQTSFRADEPARLAIVAANAADLEQKLARVASALADGQARIAAPDIFLHIGASSPGMLAFVFPGQGSQYVGMGSDLAIASDIARRVWDTAPRFDGVGLHDVAFPPYPFGEAARRAVEGKLTATEWAQPAIGAASLAMLDVLRAAGVHPACTAGHSFGELTALCAAGAIDRDDLLRLARQRGELMLAASRRSPGAMLAVHKRFAEVDALLTTTGLAVVVANYNGPEDVVVSGGVDAIGALEKALNGEHSRRLPVSAAFHSEAVAPAVPDLLSFLDRLDIRAPNIDVFGNADASPYPIEPARVRAQLAEQLARPVQFAGVIDAMYERGVRIFVEVGPGAVLTDLISRILGDRPHVAIETDRKRRHGVTSLQLALGRLAVAGVAVDFSTLWPDAPRQDVRSRKARGALVQLSGTNFGKPYPPSSPDPEPPPAPSSVARAVEPGSRIDVFQQAQHQVAETHAAFQRALSDSHVAFLRAAEASMQTLAALANGASVPMPQLPAFDAPALKMPTPPAAAPAIVTTASVPLTVDPVAAQPAAADVTADLSTMLVAIIAEKTGYQESLLGMDMDLEADLGIDSIKRVEILAALRDQAPSLPEIAPAQIAQLRTVGDVARYLREQGDPSSTPVVASAPAAIEPDDVPVDSLPRYAVRASAERALGMTLSALTAGGRFVVTDEGGGVAHALAAELARRGVHVDVVPEVPADADGVIFLGGLRAVRSVDAAVEVNKEAFRAARVVAPRFATGTHVFVAVQDTGGDFGLSGAQPLGAWLGGIGALIRTLRHEWPDASLKAIDCERAARTPDQIAAAIAEELFAGGATLDVGLSAAGARTTRAFIPSSLDTRGNRSLAGSVVVATGGGRGVTAAALIEIAQRHRCRFALVGRTALANDPAICAGVNDETGLRRVLIAEAQRHGKTVAPADIGRSAAAILAAREIRATIQALQAAGSDARYLEVDVRDRATLDRALGGVRADWGPITGLVHGAGVLADKRLEHKTDALFDRVFDTKVLGLSALLAATHDDPLEWIGLFSSVAAHHGNAGQCDYAMANEVLNLVASAEHARRNGTCVVRSIGWGPWQGGMVSAELERRFQERGVDLIPLRSGARAFVSEMSVRSADAAVVTLGSSLQDETSRRPVALDVRVDPVSHSHLSDHSIQQQPIVPLALVIEWFLRAGRAHHRDAAVSAIRNLRVCRGVKLQQFAGGERLVVQCREIDGETRCVLEFPRQGPLPCFIGSLDPIDGPARKWVAALDTIETPAQYDGVELFHGPAFQVLQSVGTAADGMTATIGSTIERGWPGEPWLTDPAASEGAMQLAVLWSGGVLGGHTLPMGIGAVHIHRSGLIAGPAKARLYAGAVRSASADCDIVITDAAGAVAAELTAVECVRRPAAASTS